MKAYMLSFYKTNPNIHYNAYTDKYGGDECFQLRELPKRPNEVFKQDSIDKIPYINNKQNPDYFDRKVQYRKD